MNILEELNRTSQINKKLLCDKCNKREVVIDYTQQLESDPIRYEGKCLNCNAHSYWNERELYEARES